MANHSEQNKTGMNPVVIVAAGIAGAAIGAAAGAALADQQTRQKLTATIKDLQDKGADMINDMKKMSQEYTQRMDLNFAKQPVPEIKKLSNGASKMVRKGGTHSKKIKQTVSKAKE